MDDAKTDSATCCAPPRGPERVAGGFSVVVNAPSDTDACDISVIVDIPGGTGLLGTSRPELPIDGEAPLRKARLKPFRMDSCAVTNARFAEFVTATGYTTDAERLGDAFVFSGFLAPTNTAPPFPNAPWWRVVEGASWRAIHGPSSEDSWHPDHPVVQVSWSDANAFAKWAGGRLPKESEWEHAARGGLGDVRYPWGDKEPDDTDYFPCNIWQGTFPDINHEGDGYYGSAPVRSFEPNGYGLFNTVGNVWEWTSTPFSVRSLKKTTQRVHAGKVGFKTLKGGSFLCHPSYCYRYRIAARTGSSPDSATSHQGFRLVYDPKQSTLIPAS
jgi:formylglycine-generating enzyme